MTEIAGDPHPDSSTAGQQAGLVSAQALSMLTLSGQPFAPEVVNGEWFSDDTTREQLVDIKEALISGDDLLLVSGVTGAGKSVLLKQLSASGGTRIQCFSVRGSERFSTFNLFSGLLEAFKLKPPAELKDTLKEVIPCLQALAERNMLGVIVLDDADRISDEELSLLLGSVQYLNSGEDTLLRILMAAEPPFESRIPELLPTASDLPYASLSIEPFDIGRAAAYLHFRLDKVGEFDEFPFSEQQMSSICQVADGLPDGLNNAAAAQLNNLVQPSETESEEYELVDVAPLLQSRPLKFALGALGCGLIISAIYLFMRPALDSPDGNGFKVVSKSPVKPAATAPETGPAADKQAPERITLVDEPKSALLPETPSAAADRGNGNGSVAEAGSVAASSEASAEASTAEPGPLETSTVATGVVTESAGTDGEAPSTLAVTATVNEPEPAASAPAAEPGQSETASAEAVTSPAEPGPADQASSAAGSAEQLATGQAATEQSAQESSALETAAPETAAAISANDKETALSGAVLESANWVLVQDPELYTVQMSASRQRKSVEAFLVRSKLDGPNSIFSFKRGDRTWYALVHGLYPTITEARNAIEKMPAAAKSNQPWIRAIAQIQNAVKNQ